MRQDEPTIRLVFTAVIPVPDIEDAQKIYANLKAFIKTSDRIMTSGTVTATLEPCCGKKKNARETKNTP